MHVFDGFAALAVEQPNAAADAVREPQTSPNAEKPPVSSTPAPPRAPAPKDAAATTAPTAKVQAPAPAPTSAQSEALQPETAPAPPFTKQRIFGPLREKMLQKPSQHASRVAACALLALLLASPVAYAFRSALAARYPVVKTMLTGVCDFAGCNVSLPQRPDLVKIEASDVHMLDAARPGLIQLTATLRSYANYDLAYPALDLVLTNANEHALARRIFVPEDYLDQTRDPHAGIPPRAEITVALDLDTGDLNAAGFRLDLIAAPTP